MHPHLRIHGVDLARSFAVLLAIIGHSRAAYVGGMHIHSDLLQVLLRGSPAIFIVVFGALLELVYVPVYTTQGPAATTHKLFTRAIQCYTLYVVSCIALSFTHGYSNEYTLRMVVMLGATPFTDILKFYAVMLVLAPLLIAIRTRYGFMPLVAFCIAVHLAHYLFYPSPYFDGFRGADVLFGFLYGATNVVAGPSVLHGITFVVTGMWLGSFLHAHRDRQRLLDRSNPQVIYLLLTSAALLSIGAVGFDGNYYRALGEMRFRNSNSYIYFAFGILGAILTIDLSLRLTTWIGAERLKPYLFLGTTSLFIFCWGNILLYYTRREVLPLDVAFIATCASVVANVVLAWAYDRVRARLSSMDNTLPAVRWYNCVTNGYADRVATYIVETATSRKHNAG